MRSSDIVRLNHHGSQTLTGRATMKIRDRRVDTKGKPTVSAPARAARLAAHTSR